MTPLRTQLTATYDPEVSALHIRVMDLPVVRTVIRGEGHMMDIGADAHIVGHEFLLDEPLQVTITDEMIERGAKAGWEGYRQSHLDSGYEIPTWADMGDTTRDIWRRDTRNTLEGIFR